MNESIIIRIEPTQGLVGAQKTNDNLNACMIMA
jgi:hypothetical protein